MRNMVLYRRPIVETVFVLVFIGHCCVCRAADRPLPENSRVSGTYFAAMTPHTFRNSPLTANSEPLPVDVAGALISYVVRYNSLGYYEAAGSQGVVFINGRKWPLSVNMVAAPFGATRQDDYDMGYHIEAQMNGIIVPAPTSGATAELQKWIGEGVLDYVAKGSGQYFKRVQYQLLNPTNSLTYYYNYSQNSAVVRVERSIWSQASSFEAKKLNDQQLYGYTPRVKIRR